MPEPIYFFIIIILLIVILYTQTSKAQVFDHLVNGFYSGDTNFLLESGLDAFEIYIDDDIIGNGERAVYILAKKDGSIIINEPCIIKLALKWDTIGDASPKYFTAEFKELSDDCSDVFAKQQKLQFYPKTGKLILHDGDTVTFVGYKNGPATEMKTVINENNSD